MPHSKLTRVSVNKLKPPKLGQIDHFDELLPSFGLRISYSGSKSWFVITRINRKQKRITLGRYPAISLSDARNLAREAMELASRGLDYRQIREEERLANEQAGMDTFLSVAEEFMVKYVEPNLKGSTAKEYRRVLLGSDTVNLCKHPVSSIKRRDLIQHLDYVASRVSDAAADYHLRYLRKFFNWCVEREIIEAAPTDRMRQRSSAQKRDRVLDENEIKQVWHAFEREVGLFGDLFKLLLLTGQRRNEVAGMRIDELRDLDGDNPIWELPANRTKNKLPHLVPLTPQMVHLIKSKSVQNGFVFTTTGSTPVSGFSVAKKRIDKLINPKMKAWTLHDLRRTMITMMNEKMGIQPHIAESVVNHITGPAKAGVAGVYNKALYLDERRAALNKWSAYVEQLIASPEQVAKSELDEFREEITDLVKPVSDPMIVFKLMQNLEKAELRNRNATDFNEEMESYLDALFSVIDYLKNSPSAFKLAETFRRLIANLLDIRDDLRPDNEFPDKIKISATLNTNYRAGLVFVAAKMDYFRPVGRQLSDWTGLLLKEGKKRGIEPPPRVSGEKQSEVDRMIDWRKRLKRQDDFKDARELYWNLKRRLNNEIKLAEAFAGNLPPGDLEKFLLNVVWPRQRLKKVGNG